MDANPDPLVLEATALSIAPQPLPFAAKRFFVPFSFTVPSIFSSFCIFFTINIFKKLPMTGFEPESLRVESNWST